jgi:hypothetical protein
MLPRTSSTTAVRSLAKAPARRDGQALPGAFGLFRAQGALDATASRQARLLRYAQIRILGDPHSPGLRGSSQFVGWASFSRRTSFGS